MDPADPQWTPERGTDPPTDYTLFPPTVTAYPPLALEPHPEMYGPLIYHENNSRLRLPRLASATNIDLEHESGYGSARWAPAPGEREHSMWPPGSSSGGPIADNRSARSQQAWASPSGPPSLPSLSAMGVPPITHLSDNFVGPQHQHRPRLEDNTPWPPGGGIQGSLDQIASTLSKARDTLHQTRVYQGGTDTALDEEIGYSLSLLSAVGVSVEQLRARIPAKSETACTACKTVKRRCDRTLPSCGACRGSGTPCSYPNEGLSGLRKRELGGVPDA